jgi:hypothetical protein
MCGFLFSRSTDIFFFRLMLDFSHGLHDFCIAFRQATDRMKDGKLTSRLVVVDDASAPISVRIRNATGVGCCVVVSIFCSG